ncbi:hypothetical protein ACFPH8_10710 [Bizionia hallyeonensis]|uniref:DUF4412 domain-containing protein n=1 Tax=Bizionia hallyeonensis TaxID=1123757 RepID=A0ABW0C745_9FLAO
MRRLHVYAITTLLIFAFSAPLHAQRGMIKRKIKNDMKEKYAEPEREKGRDAVRDVTYENDTRYPIPENPVKATLAMEIKSFKKNGKLDDTNTTKLVFGETGECMIMNEDDKNETRMLFDYKGAAMYMVNPKQKSATKMPMINFQKMAQRMAEHQMDLDDDIGTWERTNEQKEINGYNSRRYIYTNAEEKTITHVWVTQDITIDLSENHLFGGQIKNFINSPAMANSASTDENAPRGMMIRSVYFEKNRDTPSMQMDITEFSEKSDPKYFDLSNYEVVDVLGKL